ncbi:inositol 1,4,5-trisphosphate receptor-interacting protein-like 1 [Aegotheles albertisi]
MLGMEKTVPYQQWELPTGAMDAIRFIAYAMLNTIQRAHVVGEELDEATRERMRRWEEMLSREMAQLLKWVEEVGQRSLHRSTQEQESFAWGTLVFAALKQWQFWALAGVLLLLLGLWWWLRKVRHAPDNSDSEESSSSNTDEEEDEEQQQDEGESEGEDPDDEGNLGRIFAKRIKWPVQDVSYWSRVVEELVGDLLRISQDLLPNSFFPVLQPAIRVGSVFEGWSPLENDAVYCLLVPLKSPHGHAFHLELSTTEEMLAKNSHIRVELECTCTREQLGENMLCFLHNPEEKLRINKGPSLLGTLCTGSYLDVEKTALWFQSMVRLSWMLMPQSHYYNMTVLPSSRSCKLQLTNASRRTLFVEMVFGVQQGNSDIFLSSQTPESISTSSIMWPESFSVAETKFLRHVASHAPHFSFHLKCLQICARIRVGTVFSTYTMKTIVMHLLTTIPLSDWRRRDFLQRLMDIMHNLYQCLENKCLNHFFLGNERVPEEIILPPAFRTAEPLNLFQHFAEDPAAHAEALREFYDLQDRLTRLLFYGI